MFKYQELFELNKRYFYRTNQESGKREVYDREESQFVTDKDTLLRVTAALTLYTHINGYAYSKKMPTDDMQLMEEQARELQTSLLKIGQEKSYTHREVAFKNYTDSTDYFFNTATPDRGTTYEQRNNDPVYQLKISRVADTMKYLMSTRGKKVVDFKLDSEKANQTAVEFSWGIEDIPFREQLKPSNPQYTQPEKPKQATPEQQARRREFAEKLLTYYLMAETDKMYAERVDGEDKNMRFAARSINNSQQIHIEQKDFPKLMRLLLASKNISLDGQTDYFEKIISQPEVSRALAEIRDDGTFDKVKTIAERNEQEGKLINKKLKGHNETKGELGLRIANRTIAQEPGFVQRAIGLLSSNSKFPVKEQSEAIALSTVARTQGKIPSYTQNENGTFDFNSDEEKSR